jgi:hypothetical protein
MADMHPMASEAAPLVELELDPVALSLLDELSPDSSPTVVALSEDEDPTESIEPMEPLPPHIVVTESRMSDCTETLEPGMVQSPRPSDAMSLISAVQEELSHTAMIWS